MTIVFSIYFYKKEEEKSGQSEQPQVNEVNKKSSEAKTPPKCVTSSEAERGQHRKQLHVYLLCCSDQSIYVGVTNNIKRRFNEHQSGINETAYTHSRRPVVLIYVRSFNDFIEAIHYEKQVKKWSRKKKEALAMNDMELLHHLAACKNETSHQFYISESSELKT